MRVFLTDGALAAAKDHELIRLFSYGFEGRHRIIVPEEHRLEPWLVGQSADVQDMVRAALYQGIQLEARTPARFEVQVYEGQDEWAAGLLSLPTALAFLIRPFRVWVENARNDAFFLLTAATEEQRDWLQHWTRVTGSAPFEHGGGLGEMTARLKQLQGAPETPYLNAVVFDSDARRPGAPSDQTERLRLLCERMNVLHFRLNRRAAENYLPVSALSAWMGRRSEQRRRALSAFERMNPLTHRRHFHMKGGFNADGEAFSDGFYADVSEADRQDLTYGFSRDVQQAFRFADEQGHRHDGTWPELQGIVSAVIEAMR